MNLVFLGCFHWRHRTELTEIELSSVFSFQEDRSFKKTDETNRSVRSDRTPTPGPKPPTAREEGEENKGIEEKDRWISPFVPPNLPSPAGTSGHHLVYMLAAEMVSRDQRC
jgi:hypothetical protein